MAKIIWSATDHEKDLQDLTLFMNAPGSGFSVANIGQDEASNNSAFEGDGISPFVGADSAEEATNLSPGPEGQLWKAEASAGWYAVDGVPVEAAAGQQWAWGWARSAWVLYDMDDVVEEPAEPANLSEWNNNVIYTWVSTGDQFVTSGGKLWSLAVNQTATGVDVPGSSSKWSLQIDSARITNIQNRNPQEAISGKVFTDYANGSWATEVDLSSGALTNVYASSSGTVNATISFLTGPGRQYLEIPNVTAGEQYVIFSAVPVTVPVFMYATADNKVAVDAKGNLGLDTTAIGLLITVPAVANLSKIFVSGANLASGSFKVLRITGYKDGVEQRLQAQEALAPIINRANTNIVQQEGDIANGNYALFVGRTLPDGLLDSDEAYRTTDFFPVIVGNRYAATRFNNAYGVVMGAFTNHFYDINKNAVTGVMVQNSVVPAGAAYIRITFTTATAAAFNAAEYSMVLNAANQAVYLALGERFFANLRDSLGTGTILNHSNFDQGLRSSWYGKTLMYMGDSWTHQYSAIDGGNFARKIQKRFGFSQLYRCAQGGQTFCQLQQIITFSATHRYFPLPSEAAINGVDCTVVFLGQNSRVGHASIPGSGAAIGTIDDPASLDPLTSTIYGQAKYYVEWLLTKNNKMRIFLSSPGFSYENNGAFLPRLGQISAALKNVAAFYRIGYIPTFEEGWGAFNYESYLRKKAAPEVSDWLHPSYTSAEINGTNGSDRIYEIHAKYIFA
ncbi:SGNH/GDSL hydrolase family protein [Sphingobacterium deserti]|uniref:Uncharacterized protein n=1 Tax=Sphingobacterium deserti TaxID=1229276 RepID=A0A0B8T7B8_9SPHI|nr:SGNH/GDSL hydrolase family protein [Sphingobacterium deserti]KGE14324.1 hypothetical protein DI53_1938 [Sphingobacterium deserti]